MNGLINITTKVIQLYFVTRYFLLFLLLGCTTNPGTKSKYCDEHKHLQQPCIASTSLNPASLKLLTSSRNQKTITIGDDTVFVIEGCQINIKETQYHYFFGILDSELRQDGRYLLIKWESYGISTW